MSQKSRAVRGAGFRVGVKTPPEVTTVPNPVEMWYYSPMARQKNISKKTGNSGFVIGRERFAKISAVEGIELSGAMKKRIDEDVPTGRP